MQGSAHGPRVLGSHVFLNILKNMRGIECLGGPGEGGVKGS